MLTSGFEPTLSGTQGPRRPHGIRRVILVVLDGLRPDAILLFGLPHLERLRRRGAATFTARTVSPSVTAAAMGSLLTGVEPLLHGLDSDRFRLPQPRIALDPLPAVLAAAGLPTSAHLAAVPPTHRGIAARLARRLGVSDTSFAGHSAPAILRAGHRSLESQDTGLLFFHWPDADRAGHRYGWMSREYAVAARLMDSALGTLVARSGVLTDQATLLIALADHGGGGREARDHDSPHARDTTIPIILAGGAVVPFGLGAGASLLDIPATVLWALGVPVPPSYAGRPLAEAFPPVLTAAVA
jgi:predicted AlkP superfamily pyrophosphatase or phosphodiesterase